MEHWHIASKCSNVDSHLSSSKKKKRKELTVKTPIANIENLMEKMGSLNCECLYTLAE